MFFILIQLYAILICHYWIVVIFFSSNLIKLNYLFCIFSKVCGNFNHYEKKKKNKQKTKQWKLLPSNLDTRVSLSVGICWTTKGAKSSTVTAARALRPDATVLKKKIYAGLCCLTNSWPDMHKYLNLQPLLEIDKTKFYWKIMFSCLPFFIFQ